uniref:Homeobox domain-containing protein n=1 Tax=Leptobrachium leishanense TaxID=445787 RepID=A0A8C5QF33_9ANUR
MIVQGLRRVRQDQLQPSRGGEAGSCFELPPQENINFRGLFPPPLTWDGYNYLLAPNQVSTAPQPSSPLSPGKHGGFFPGGLAVPLLGGLAGKTGYIPEEYRRTCPDPREAGSWCAPTDPGDQAVMAPLLYVQQNAFSVQDTMEDHAASNQVHGGGSEPQSPQSVLLDHLQDAFRNINLKETKSWDEVLKFTEVFKQKRSVFGHQQDAVGVIVLSLFDKQMSQTTICRFENGKLSLKNMYSIKPFMEKYIMATEQNPEIIQVILQERTWHGWKMKKQTKISAEARAKLVKCHMLHKKPNVQQILKISKQTDLPNETVQAWFSNRREKLKSKDRKTRIWTLPMVSQHVPAPCNPPHGYMSLLMDSDLQATTEPNAIMYNHPDAQMNLYSHGPM